MSEESRKRYVIQRQIAEARRLPLEMPECSVDAIGYDAGQYDLSHFLP